MSPQRLLNLSLMIILVLLVPILYAGKGLAMLSDLHRREWGGADFTAYYTAADLIAEGQNPYDTSLFASRAANLGFRSDRPYIYPPFLAIALIPLTLLPPQGAALVWFGLNIGFLLLSLVLLSVSSGIHRHSTHFLIFLLGALTFYPVIFSLFVGQVNILVLFLLVLFWTFLEQRREALAGLALGAASMIKLLPLILGIFLLWKGRSRPALWAVATMLSILALGTLLIGLEPHWAYLTSVLPTQYLQPHPLNQSLNGFLARLLVASPGEPPRLWPWLPFLLSGLLLLTTFLLIPRGQADPRITDAEVSFVVLAMLLISSVTWVATLVLLLLPYASIAKLPSKGSGRWLLAAGVLVSYLLISTQRLVEMMIGGMTPGSSISPWALGLPLYGTAILWLTLAYLLMARTGGPGARRHPV